MKQRGLIGWMTALLGLLGSALSSSAAITMNLVDPSTYSSVFNNEYIGVYSFEVTATEGSVPVGNFWSICLSPFGVLDNNPHTYNLNNFNAAAPGLNAPTWSGSSPGAAGYGIQNAQYLWQVFGSSATALSGTVAGGTVGSVQDRGAGLAAAMYVALYNSSGLGVINLALPNYDPTIALGLNGNAETDMNADLTALDPTLVSSHESTGSVLVPDPVADGSGQEFIILASQANFAAAPEPATTGMIAGMFAAITMAGLALRPKKS